MSEILILASITLLAAMSPGPDAIVVIKNALRSKKVGYATALGIMLANLIHIGYCIAGIGLIVSQSILLFSVIKTLGALYLLFIAYKLLRSKKEAPETVEKWSHRSSFSAFREGFLTSVTNPKVTLFFLSVFTQVIAPETPLFLQVQYGLMMATIAGTWFVVLTMIINLSYIKTRITGVQYTLDKIMGVLLTLLGLKILFSSK